MLRDNHYERAFEAYLQWHRIPYVAVDETRRSFLGEERVKSLDFLLIGGDEIKLLVDIKGRRYPGGSEEKPRRVWECWSTLADIDGLGRWAERFGQNYQPLLVFMYRLMPYAATIPEGEELWTWHDQRYLLRAIAVEEYRRCMRSRSPKWGTMTLTRSDYLRLVRPFPAFLDPAAWSGTLRTEPFAF
jgi:hypothetical protein